MFRIISRRNKGQSILEYITVFTAIVAVIVLLAMTKLRPAISHLLDNSAAKIEAAGTDFGKVAVSTDQPATETAPGE